MYKAEVYLFKVTFCSGSVVSLVISSACKIDNVILLFYSHPIMFRITSFPSRNIWYFILSLK